MGGTDVFLPTCTPGVLLCASLPLCLCRHIWQTLELGEWQELRFQGEQGLALCTKFTNTTQPCTACMQSCQENWLFAVFLLQQRQNLEQELLHQGQFLQLLSAGIIGVHDY